MAVYGAGIEDKKPAGDGESSAEPKGPAYADGDLAKEINEVYKRDRDFEDNNWKEAQNDLNFCAGEQWDTKARQERETDGRPVVTIDQTGKYIRAVAGDIRINRPAIKVSPVDDRADVDRSKILTGLIRHIEYASKAHTAYVSGAESAARCGMGHWRVLTKYCNDDTFEQDIRIKAIRNPFSVLWDSDAEEYDRDDAQHCFVIGKYSKQAFKARWPKANCASFDASEPTDINRLWYDGKEITVAEFWKKKPVTKRIMRLPDGVVADVTGLKDEEISARIEEIMARLVQENREPVEVRDRTAESHVVCQYFFNGTEFLEEPYEWMGRHIPIVSVWGEEIHIGDRTVRKSIIRSAKDPQRLLNYYASANVERYALAPKAPFIVKWKWVQKFTRFWDTANTKNWPYLPIESDADGLPQRQAPPLPDAAAVSGEQQAQAYMHETTGVYPASLGAKSNETSGKAIIARQREGDVGTFLYADNLAMSVARTGEILVDLIPKVYDTERSVRILGEDDAEELVKINQVVPGGGALKNDITVGKYDVRVSRGPSFGTRREEARESTLAFMQAYPAAAAAIGDLIAKYQDWPGAEEIAKRLRILAIRQGFVEPDPDQGDPPPAPPPPPDPAVVAKAERDAAAAQKDIATAGKVQAEAAGQALENALMQFELAGRMGELQAIIEQAATMAATAASQAVLRSLGARAAPRPGAIPAPGPTTGIDLPA